MEEGLVRSRLNSEANLTLADGHEAGRGVGGFTPNGSHYPINKK